MGSQQLNIEHWIRLPSSVSIMKTIMCLAAIVAVSSALLPGPPAPYGRPGYPRPSPFGGAMDPTTLLLLNKNGGLGGGSGSSSLLPLLLLGGGGLGGGHGKGGFNPLLFSLLGGCTEQHSPCTKIADANTDNNKQCGDDTGRTSCNGQKCNMCCTCND